MRWLGSPATGFASVWGGNGWDESEREDPALRGRWGLVLGTLVATKVLFELGLWAPQACSGMTAIKNSTYVYAYISICV